MTDRELMQQALDAMLNFPNDISDEMFESIRVLRARLAQPEQEIESDRDPVEDDGCPTEKAVLQRFWREHQTQEPVAKMREMLEVQGRDGNWNYDAYMQGMYNGMEFMVALAEGRDPVFRSPPEKWIDSPPQREWQGLTDEEIKKIEMSASSKLSAIYLAEAQLKGKNYDKS